MTRRLLLFAVAAAVLSGCAQSSPRRDPGAGEPQAAALEYRSAFAGYAPFRDEPLAPWRAANETVKEHR